MLTIYNNRNKNNGLSLFDDFAKSFFGYHDFPWLGITPSTNVLENETNYNVELSVPGFKKDEINIDVEDGILTISAKYETSDESKNENFSRKEFSKKSFTKSFQIPEDVDIEKISAQVEDGILNVILDKKLPQIEEKKTKRIEIK